MTDGNVTRVFSPEEALAFVIERGVVTMPIAELATAWGWPHCTQVYRALDRWVRDGLIERQGKVIRARAEESDSTSESADKRLGCHDRLRGGPRRARRDSRMRGRWMTNGLPPWTR